MLISCPECTKQISDKAIACPNCGYPINVTKNTQISRQSRRKYHRLPNGYGTIKRLSGNRRNPYAVYPPTTEYTDSGCAVSRKAIGYFDSYENALKSLNEYNFKQYDINTHNITFEEVYKMYFADKFNNQKKSYSKSSISSSQASFENLKPLHKIPIKDIKTDTMQRIIDECTLKHSSLELMIMTLKQTFTFALQHDYIEKNYADFVKIKIADDDEKGVPFTESDIKKMWEHSDDKSVQIMLILIYSGMRISELETVKVDEEKKIFVGGVKTKAGKNRTIPIHNAIMPFIDSLNGFKAQNYRTSYFYPTLKTIGIDLSNSGTKHTPHDCRHTFSWLWDKYVNPPDSLSKHIILGHSLKGDVEVTVYGHRTIEELKEKINMIVT